MIPASLNMPIMSGGEAVAPPAPMSWDANTLGYGMQLSNSNLTVAWLIGNVLFSSYYGYNVCGNSQKAYGKWQYTVRCTAAQSGNSSGSAQTQAIFGISKKHRWSIGQLGKATYDYCLKSLHSTSEVFYKTNNNVDTVLLSGAGTCPEVGDYITVLVDFDLGGIWFAFNGTVLEGDPNAGTSPSFTFTPNHGFVPCCTLTRNGAHTPGTYVLEETLIYGTWGLFNLWNTDEEVGLDEDIGYDPNHASTSLVWVADGIANGTTSLTDTSAAAVTLTNNLATVDATDDVLNSLQTTCGNGCLYFDGNDSFTASPITPFQLGTGDFCIEFYYKRSSAPATEEIIYDGRNSATSTLIPTIVVATTGLLRVFYSGAYRLTSVTDVVSGLWHHVAIVRSGDNIGLYINGVRHQNITGATGVNYTANALRVGASYVPNGYSTARINFIRVTKGNSRYGTSSFIPPRFWLAT